MSANKKEDDYRFKITFKLRYHDKARRANLAFSNALEMSTLLSLILMGVCYILSVVGLIPVCLMIVFALSFSISVVYDKKSVASAHSSAISLLIDALYLLDSGDSGYVEKLVSSGKLAPPEDSRLAKLCYNETLQILGYDESSQINLSAFDRIVLFVQMYGPSCIDGGK